MNADTTLGVYFLRKFFLYFFEWLFSLHFSRDRTLLKNKQKSKLILQKTKKGERMQKERKKERKKIIAIRRHTHKRLTRVPKGRKGKKGSKAQASDGRRARFLFSVVRRVFETE